MELSVEMRWRPEFRDNADFKPADDMESFVGQRIRISLRARASSRLSFFIQGQDVWLFHARSDKVVHDLATNLHQAYLEWKLPGPDRWSLLLGRQELIYGEERLVGAFGWDNVGRSFDAGRLRYARSGWTADVMWARQVNVRRAGAPARAGDLDLSGVYATRLPAKSAGRWEVYGLFLRDGLRTAGELGLTAPRPLHIFTAGYRRVYEPKTGWRYSVENAWQFGKRGPDPHRAVMLVATTGYAWDRRFRPRVGFEYDFATGDNDPHDGRSNEFNNLFPTNHIYYGYADLVGLRNIHDFRITGAFSPLKKLTLDADWHRFLLAAPRGPWKSATGKVLGFDPTGQSGRDLGQEFDFTARVPLQAHVNLLGGFCVFLPGRFAISTRGPESNRFGYIQTTVRF